ncbi:phosphoribosylanthranilate isomerase [Flavobacterium cerinum]|uniref:N-(5'-phosphoribosyl)anthranilate isomerase n=1 Tax=Flavobacterium cerinum TaxID=2502784 RepID=A0A444GLN8_9FLAO|nr:phosphoribosylanthranilate isomerase [Flavobacterium cerinum]RWW91894.1 phosphoribosylanthranilate isomerase [Flavobacterium cerinum]
MKIKICGMKYPENIKDIALLKPDHLGFIFYSASKRFVGEDFKFSDFEKTMANIDRVAVFVNESNTVMEKMVEQYNINIIQLHGDESPQQCKDLKEKRYIVIKAFSMAEGFDFSILKDYELVTDYFLFDTKTTGYGGSGQAFNWQLLNQYNLSRPFFLSGGLGVHNIEQFLEFSHPMLHGYDFNSRLEIKPGLKDKESASLIIDKIKKI